MSRPAYPLADETKILARQLVDAWKSGDLPQKFTLSRFPGGGRTTFAIHEFNRPIMNINLSEAGLEELAHFDLLKVDARSVTMFQELRNAVDGDFALTDFALLNSPHQLKEHLEELLAAQLDGNEVLRDALTGMFSENDATRYQKAGKVIEQLGNSIQHLSNTGGAITALSLIVKLLGG